MSALIGEEQAQRLVNKALVLITLGGNDFVNNYFFTPITARRLQYNLQDFSRYLIVEYRKILMVTYSFSFYGNLSMYEINFFSYKHYSEEISQTYM